MKHEQQEVEDRDGSKVALMNPEHMELVSSQLKIIGAEGCVQIAKALAPDFLEQAKEDNIPPEVFISVLASIILVNRQHATLH